MTDKQRARTIKLFPLDALAWTMLALSNILSAGRISLLTWVLVEILLLGQYAQLTWRGLPGQRLPWWIRPLRA